MIIKLQVNENGVWGNLNTRFCNDRDDEEELRVMAELAALQTTWASNYARYKGAHFRIVKTK